MSKMTVVTYHHDSPVISKAGNHQVLGYGSPNVHQMSMDIVPRDFRRRLAVFGPRSAFGASGPRGPWGALGSARRGLEFDEPELRHVAGEGGLVPGPSA